MQFHFSTVRLSTINRVLAAMLALYFAAAFFCQWGDPTFGTDSISYYKLAETLGGDFYRASYIRQYVIPGDYGCSFPPLWPVLIGLMDLLTGLGIYGGYVLAFLFGALTLWPMVLTARELIEDRAVAWFAAIWGWCCLAVTSTFISAMDSADTWALAAFLWWGMTYLFVKQGEFGPRRAAALGLLAGLACLNRFDCNLLALLLTGAVAWRARSGRLVTAAVYALTVAVVVSPWVYYSVTHFGRLYVADNSLVAAAVPSIGIRDYFTEPVPTLRDDFAGWAGRVADGAVQTVLSGVRAVVKNKPAFYALLIAAVLWAWDRVRRGKTGMNRRWPPASFNVMLLISLVPLAGLALTGYFIFERYFQIVCSVIGFWAILAMRSALVGGKLPLPWAMLVTGLIAMLVLRRVDQSHFGAPTLRMSTDFAEGPGFAAVAARLRPDDRVLSLNGKDADFCYATGAFVFTRPTNWLMLSPEQKQHFLETYSVTAVVFPEGDSQEARSGLELAPVGTDGRFWRPAPASP